MSQADSSGWLEYFADGKNADFFTPAIESVESLIVSTINLYDVFKHILQKRGEDNALLAVNAMQEGKVIKLDESLALQAAKISSELKIPMADSIILATARKYGAILWTQDRDFEGFYNVKFVPKK